MNQQNNADDSMNFSIIDKNDNGQRHVDFSVQSLLENGEQSPKPKEDTVNLQTTRHNVFEKIKKINQKNGRSIIQQTPTIKLQQSQNFLKDLSRMEKELSFQTQSYNIYEYDPNCSNENIQNCNKSKTLSYLKVTKDTYKQTSKVDLKDYNDYYGYLIIDFNDRGKGKEKMGSRTDLKIINHNISSENSHSHHEKSRKNSKNMCQSNALLRLKQKKSISKSKFTPFTSLKSKSKSITHKFEKSKSKSHLKANNKGQNCEEKVFTEYYGTDINIRPQRNEHKKQNENLTLTISRTKSSKSKLGLLSPRQSRKVQPHLKKKINK